MSKNENLGQAAPLLLLALATGVFFATGLAQLGVAAIDSARASTAADAAALSGALDGKRGAIAAASRNGADLTSASDSGTDFDVVVSVNGALAHSRARRVIEDSGNLVGLSTEMLAAIAQAEALLGQSIPVVSGFRSRASQQALWDTRATNPYPVAVPGTSAHESGRAIDVPSEFVSRLLGVARIAGLCHPLPIRDPIHFVLCPTPQK